MNSLNFGIFVSEILKESELYDSQKETVISYEFKNVNDDMSTVSLPEILSELDELDYATFGRISAYCLYQRKLLNKALNKNLSLKKQRYPKRLSKTLLNEPSSFHNGRPCIRCNKLANYFNNKQIKILLPRQHLYSKCPLYCNLCPSKFACEYPEQHLYYSCNKCSTDYSNHPTEHCVRK